MLPLSSLLESIEVADVATSAFVTAILLKMTTWLYKYTKMSKEERNAKPLERPPSALPLLRNTLDLIRNMHDIHGWVSEQCCKLEGRPWKMGAFNRTDRIILSHPMAVQDIYKKQFDNFQKTSEGKEYMRELLGDGIFTSDGHKWILQRKTASNLFTARKLRDSMASSVRTHAVTVERVLVGSMEQKSPVDLFRLFNRFTLESFVEIGFGVHLNCIEEKEEHPFQLAFDGVQEAIFMRFMRPTFIWKLQGLLGLGYEGVLSQGVQVIDTTVFDIIAQALKNRADKELDVNSKDEPPQSDIVSLFLDSHQEGEKFDPKFLRDIVMNFLIAGRDTTAQALSWFVYCLSCNPEVEAKIREEILEKLPCLMDGSTKFASLEQVSTLTYLEAALKETLRLYPSVPFNARQAIRDTTLSDGTFVKAGTNVAVPSYSLGRMENVWGPDAKEFKPERWIDEKSGKLITVSAFKFHSFHAGPRTCLGQNLAMMEMKILASGLLSRYHFNVLNKERVTYGTSPTLPMKYPLMVQVERVTKLN